MISIYMDGRWMVYLDGSFFNVSFIVLLMMRMKWKRVMVILVVMMWKVMMIIVFTVVIVVMRHNVRRLGRYVRV